MICYILYHLTITCVLPSTPPVEPPWVLHSEETEGNVNLHRGQRAAGSKISLISPLNRRWHYYVCIVYDVDMIIYVIKYDYKIYIYYIYTICMIHHNTLNQNLLLISNDDICINIVYSLVISHNYGKPPCLMEKSTRNDHDPVRYVSHCQRV